MRAPALIVLALVLVGCGGADEPERQDGSKRDPAGTVVAALGDSITAGTPLWDPDPALRAQIPQPDRRSQYGYWAERANARTSFRNCGVAGELTEEIAQRLDDCAEGADVLVVQGGVNDIAQGRPPREAAVNLRAMVRRGQTLGLRVTLVEVLPWNGGYPAAAAPIRELNGAIAALGREEGVPVQSWYRVLEDPRRPGRMRPPWTIDLAHPSIEGYRRLGEALELPPP